MVSQYARAENACSEEVTAQICVSPENVGDRLVAVFFCTRRRGQESVIDGGREEAWPTVPRDDIPHRRIERYGSQRNKKGRFRRVDEGIERHGCHVVVEDRATTLHAWPENLRTSVCDPGCSSVLASGIIKQHIEHDGKVI